MFSVRKQRALGAQLVLTVRKQRALGGEPVLDLLISLYTQSPQPMNPNDASCSSRNFFSDLPRVMNFLGFCLLHMAVDLPVISMEKGNPAKVHLQRGSALDMLTVGGALDQ